jgi:hypothetical protein
MPHGFMITHRPQNRRFASDFDALPKCNGTQHAPRNTATATYIAPRVPRPVTPKKFSPKNPSPKKPGPENASR